VLRSSGDASLLLEGLLDLGWSVFFTARYRSNYSNLYKVVDDAVEVVVRDLSHKPYAVMANRPSYSG
jgi:hypothetical protein